MAVGKDEKVVYIHVDRKEVMPGVYLIDFSYAYWGDLGVIDVIADRCIVNNKFANMNPPIMCFLRGVISRGIKPEVFVTIKGDTYIVNFAIMALLRENPEILFKWMLRNKDVLERVIMFMMKMTAIDVIKFPGLNAEEPDFSKLKEVELKERWPGLSI